MELMDIRRGLMMGMTNGKNVICEAGSYTPETDVYYGSVNIPHGLGVKPDFIIAYADGIEALESYTDSEKYICWFAYGKSNIFYGDAQKEPYFASYIRTRPGYNSCIYQNELIQQKFVTETSFRIGGYQSNDMLKGGVTYRYVIGKYQE